MALVRSMTVSDFHDVHLPRLSQSPLLDPILESGEITFGALSESQESFQVSRWGKGLSISFVLMVNDRLNLINDQIRAWGYAVAETESRALIAFSNPERQERDRRWPTDSRCSMPECIITCSHPQPRRLRHPSMRAGVAVPEANRPLRATAGTSAELRTGAARRGDRSAKTGGYDHRDQRGGRERVCQLASAGGCAVGRSEKMVFVRWIREFAPVFFRATLAGFEAPTVQSQIDFLTDNVAVKCVHNFGFGVADYVGASTNPGCDRCPVIGRPKTNPGDELLALRAQLVAALGQGTAEVETPQLGRVMYRSIAEIKAAIAWIDAQTALLNTGASTFVFKAIEEQDYEKSHSRQGGHSSADHDAARPFGPVDQRRQIRRRLRF